MVDNVIKVFITALRPGDIQQIHRMIYQMCLGALRHIDQCEDFHLLYKSLLQNGYFLGISEVAETRKI